MSLAAALLASAAADKRVITAMLIVGLIFVGVVVLGDLTHYLRERRRGH
jgi:hypothetical protein